MLSGIEFNQSGALIERVRADRIQARAGSKVEFGNVLVVVVRVVADRLHACRDVDLQRRAGRILVRVSKGIIADLYNALGNHDVADISVSGSTLVVVVVERTGLDGGNRFRNDELLTDQFALLVRGLISVTAYVQEGGHILVVECAVYHNHVGVILGEVNSLQLAKTVDQAVTVRKDGSLELAVQRQIGQRGVRDPALFKR